MSPTLEAGLELDDGPAIELRGVTKAFGDRVVLDAIDVEIPTGKTTVLLGPSGTGKSTLIRLAVGLMAPTKGEVFVLGQPVNELSRHDLLALRRRFGMLFQDGALFQSLTVTQNVGFPLLHVKGVSGRALEERVEELLDLVGLPGLGHRTPDELSGGQRKRVALARAIAMEPDIVFFDEPTSGLDPQTSASIDELIHTMQARLKRTFVVITHDTLSARAIAHSAGVLWDGRLRAWGSAEDVWATDDPIVRRFLDRKPALHPPGDLA